MTAPEHMVVDLWKIGGPNNRGDYQVARIRAGVEKVERVVPPAGEADAFSRSVWPTTVEVYVSPTGRSVRVFLNGEEIKP